MKKINIILPEEEAEIFEKFKDFGLKFARMQ